MQTLYLDVDKQLDLNLRLPTKDKEPAPKIRLPSFGPNDFEALSKEFVKKSPAPPVADANMTPPSSPIPTSTREATAGSTPPTVDPYLSSIVSSVKPSSKSVASSDQEKSSSCMCVRCKGKPTGQPVHCKNPVDCPCYRCQKQRRRALTMGKNNASNTNVSTISKKSKGEPDIPLPRRVQSSKENSPANRPQLLKAQTMPAARSLSLRKKPSVLSYNKYRRKEIEPSDSIYDATSKAKRSSIQVADDRSMVSHNTVDSYCSNEDKYEISWKDDAAGEDILEPLKCFIDIFDKNPDEKTDGLSDILEDGTRNLQMQKKLAAQQAELARKKQADEKLPPRLDVLTPSYRHGPAHKSLTLYHLMKCKQRKERLMAYNIAYNNCINGNSGLNDWMKKQNNKGLPTPMLAYVPQQQRKQAKKSLFRSPLKHAPSIRSSRSSQDKQMYSTHNNTSMFLTPISDTPRRLSNDESQPRPTDVLKAASALLPGSNKSPDLNRSQTNLGITKPYNHIDAPRRPRGRSSSDHGTSSQSSEEEKQSVATIRQVHVVDQSQSSNPVDCNISSQPMLKIEQEDMDMPAEQSSSPSEPLSNALDDLCSVLPHVERSTLQMYLDRADGDYMKALDLCKVAVVSGEL